MYYFVNFCGFYLFCILCFFLLRQSFKIFFSKDLLVVNSIMLCIANDNFILRSLSNTSLAEFNILVWWCCLITANLSVCSYAFPMTS